ncbi:MAG: hypothetical protein CVU05_06095 [Bacteroidetes bacterium HGW-Bacteroidetes-21]|jgi:hypothetical protein|nr:MAG: hypothetical protein CVU05_06095 [Bacteroidetes bacterium HGW-Bacteroidetes-21]
MLLKTGYYIVFLIFFSSGIYAQSVVTCDSTLSFWVIPNDSINYTLNLSGRVQTTEKPMVIAVNNYALQYLIVEKKYYTEEKGDNSDLKILIRYALSECEYLSNMYKTKLNLQMQKAPVSNNNEVLIWYYAMPEDLNEQVKYQVYANLVLGDKIFGIASPQFSDQTLNEIKDFLMDVISTLKQIEEPEKLCK